MVYAISWGRRLYGKVDEVPGRCHVATLFFTFCYLPLVPLETWLVTSKKSRGLRQSFTGMRIPMSWKSCALAWIRIIVGSFLFVSGIVSVSAACVLCSPDGSIDLLTVLCDLSVTVLAAMVFFGSYYYAGIGRASPARAAELENILARLATAQTQGQIASHATG